MSVEELAKLAELADCLEIVIEFLKRRVRDDIDKRLVKELQARLSNIKSHLPPHASTAQQGNSIPEDDTQKAQ